MSRFVFLMLLFTLGLLSGSTVWCQNSNLSNGLVFEGEPYLVINPLNPRHIVVSWMGYTFNQPIGIKTIASFNGGTSWSNPVIQPHFSPNYLSADPSMVFDNAGNVYTCYIDYREAPDSGGIYITSSADGGLHWSFLSKAMDAWADGAKIPIDRPWLTVNPVNNNLYITSKPAPWIAAPNRPYFISSENGGQTWSPWRYIDSTGFLVGNYIKQPMAAPSISQSGAFHCIYPSWLLSQNFLPGYLHAKTTSNGNSFTYNSVYHSSTGIDDTLAKTGGRLVCDPVEDGHLVYIFLENKYGDLDVFMIESFTDGATWSTPIRLNNDLIGNGKMQDLIWTDFSSNGDLVVAWRDRRAGDGTGYATKSEILGTLRWHDSTSFSDNFRISDTLAAYHNVLSLNGNDFMSLAVADDTLSAVWGDARKGILNIWFSRISLHALQPVGIRNIVHEEIPDITIFPNPGNSIFTLQGDDVLEVMVNSYSGALIKAENSGMPVKTVDLSRFAPGIYMMHIRTAKGVVSQSVIVK